MNTIPVRNLLNLCAIMMRPLAVAALAFVVLWPDCAQAQVPTNSPPDRLSYQGFLTDANGNPLAPVAPQNFTIVFRIWTAPTAGVRLWTEQQVVTVDKGNFSVVLGEGSQYLAETRPLLGSVLANSANASDRYIGINVTINGTPTEILPRLRLLPTPYSFLSTSARNLTSAGGGAVVTHTNNRVEVTGDLFASGTISGNGAGLSGVVVPATSITSGILPDARLSGNVAFRNVVNTFTANQIISGANLGLGTAVPGFPLSFADSLGDKIALYGQSGDNFGIGIAPSTLQIHANNAASDVAFGYGNSGNNGASMTEVMRIKGNGNVGIGTATPGAKLTVNGGIGVIGANVLEFGAGVAGKEVSAGKIGYQAFTAGALDIVGAGTTPTSRRVQVYAEGGTTFNGGLGINGNVGVNGVIGIGTDTPTAALQIGSVNTTGDAYIRMESIGGNNYANGIKFRNFNDAYGWDIINQERGGAGLQADGLHIIRHNADATGVSTLFIAKVNGFMGIGTTTPQATLHVAGAKVGATGNGNYFNYNIGNGAGVPDGNAAGNIIAYFEGDIVSSYSIFSMQNPTFSDARAKTIVRRSSGQEDLQTLDRIQITDFRWIDQTKGNTGIHKKVIAQEVEEVLPNAVSHVTKVIPNLYQQAASLSYDAKQHHLTVSINKAHNLQTGDQVDVYTDRGDLTKAKVLDIPSTNAFTVASEFEPKEGFVYGKWVNDYRVVDYDAIAMLNVSATQELHRKLRTQQTEIESLKQALADLKTSEKIRDAKTAALEKLVNQLALAAGVGAKAGQAAIPAEREQPGAASGSLE